jgi:hydroxymethylpyrimidine pyrophosphatase-like HAD family hydrolase
MKNAHPLVVEAANYQTLLSNSEHGVSDILRKIASV